MAIGEVTRITSKNLVIEFQPAAYPRHEAKKYAAYGEELNHETEIYLNGATSGTFCLAVNGHKTSAIDISGFSSNGVQEVQAALDALPYGANALTVTAGTDGDFNITATPAGVLENEFLVIEILDDTTSPGVTQIIQQQGSKFYQLQAEVQSFSYSETQESVDTTGISETSRRHTSTVGDATFEITLYEALKDYRAILYPGVEGYLRVFEDGKQIGKRYFAWEVLLNEGGSSFEQFEKVEIDVSGRRQGAPIARVGSIWSGS